MPKQQPPAAEQVDAYDLPQRLEQLTGVERALVDTDRHEIWLVLRGDVDPSQTEDAARRMIADETLTVAAVFRPEHRDRQRVRFVTLESAAQPNQEIRYTTTLEWSGKHYLGTAVGERGEVIELRTVAASTLDAVGNIVPGELTLRLAGTKLVRAFDAELVVVSLYRPDAKPHNLVGAVVTGEDPRRASATAVLNALNRLLGNYLVLP